MSQRKFHLHDGKHGIALAVRLKSGSAANVIHALLEDGTVEIGLFSKSVDNDGNKELVKFLSSVLDIPTGKIEIIGGQSGNNKLLTIMGIDMDEAQQRLQANLHIK
jgi:uncharacterized protein YggU (UPF0235/DUF167 family)